ALKRLEDEFLLRHLDDDRWVGLHELRSRTVATRLHELPPPSEAETLAQLLPLVGQADRKTLIVAAALGGHDLAPLGVATEEVLLSGGLNATAVYNPCGWFAEAADVID